MPLLWSHAEFLKLLIARANGRPFELLNDVEKHFSSAKACRVTVRHWRAGVPFSTLERDVSLLIEDSRPFTLHWGVNNWQQIQDRDATDAPWGLCAAVRFSAAELSDSTRLDFTRCYADGWEGVNHSLARA
jgi:glucoamylase